MKVALLSFHNAYNYGAALQAYGLQCAVQKMGVECEYLDYQNETRKHAYDMNYQFAKAVSEKNIVMAAKMLFGKPVMKQRADRFKAFYSKYLKVSDCLYENSVEAKKANNKYDKFIVGSDQVWNYSNNGGDTAFLLDFVDDDTKKVSYSSSFGVSSLTPELSQLYGKFLKKFNRLAVRESIGTEIVENITGRQAHLVLDPVFLAGRDEWEKIRTSVNSSSNKNKYIFFYTNRQSQITDFLNTGYTTNEQYHVLSTHITIKEFLNKRIKTRLSISPAEFLDEIYSADLVVTASFHCLAFAIIYHKQFIVILTGDHGKDERLTNLLKITGLQSRVLTSATSKENVQELIDYDEVDKRIERYLLYSREYLRRAIFDEPDLPLEIIGSNKRFCQDSRCTGCGACETICPRDAISMTKNEEGFLIPIVDESKCIRCYKCHSVCQIYNKNTQISYQQYYAVKSNDEIRRSSSSGGVFRALAQKVMADGGVVCAAGMENDFRVHHMFATNEEELLPMCGTYYVQSEIGDTYKKIRDYLNGGTKVLFVGTGCQVAGLQNYLGQKSEYLLTCDIICHGAPSPLVFERFIEYLETRGRVSEFKFRDKSLGWKGYCVSTRINGEFISDKLWLQSFNYMFSHNMINRLSCGACSYTNYDRCGDITIGDFWGLEKTHPEILDSLGVSLVLTNTEKGDRIIKSLSFKVLVRVAKKDTIQNSLIKPSPISSKRMQVFQSFRKVGYEMTAKKFAEVNSKGWLKNVIRKCYVWFYTKS